MPKMKVNLGTPSVPNWVVLDSNNADTVDSYHAGNASGQVPVSNGTLNTNLNADMIDGKHSSDLSIKATAFGTTGNSYEQVAYYENDGASQVGTLKITMPKGWSNTMLTMVIKGYDYSSNGAYELIVGGYNSTTPAWTNCTVTASGPCPFNSARFAYDGTNCCLLLGTTATSWQYPKIYIDKVIASHLASTGWGTGWSISLITSETGIANVLSVSVTPPGTNANTVNNYSTATASTASTVAVRDASGNLTAKQLISDVAQGTAPLTVTSTTKISNLNADQVDGYNLNQGVQTTDSPTFVKATFSQATGTAPMTVTSTTAVTNLNADMVDGYNLNQGVQTTDSPTFVKATFSQATGTAPMTVTSTTAVTNLNADMVDGLHTATASTASTVAARDASGNLTAKQLVSDVAQGTAPMTVTSTTAVTNLNADMVDGYHLDQGVKTTDSPTHAKLTLTQATGTAPMTVTSTTKVTNLNVDQVDGYDAGNASGNIPISNGTVNTNLNADMVDGLHTATASTASTVAARDASGNLTAKQLVSDIAQGTAPMTVTSTTKVTNLNVEQVDGYDAGNASGNIPVSNGTINTNLNADKLDGYDASAFPLKNANLTGTVSIYEQVAAYDNSVNNQVGTLKITLPKGWSSTMLNIVIKGYDYSANGAYELILGGYNYITTPSWNNCTASVNGPCPFTSVRFGYDGTNCCILLGITTTTWQYPKIYIDKVMASFSNQTGWGTGWSIALITSETGIANIVSATLNAGLNSDTVDGYHAGNASGNIPISNGTVNTNLNADTVDGYHAGNASGNVSVANGTVNTNLNADMVDGYHLDQGVKTTDSPTHAKLTLTQATGTAPMTVTSTTAVTNLNADMVDGLHAGNASGQVPISNATVNTNLNADMVDGLHVATASTASTVAARDASGNLTAKQLVSDIAQGTAPMTVTSTTKVTNLNVEQVDGYDAGNASGNIPVSNGTINTNLNADMVDGLHAGNASGNIPISNGTANTNLNADMVDGLHTATASTASTVAARDASGNLTAKQLVSDIAQGTAPMTVTSTTKVTNLNADLVDGYQAGNASGNVPVSNGTVNTNLNADLLDGQHGAYYAPIASPTFTGTVTLPPGSTSDNLLRSLNTSIAAAGTTQATATVLTKDINVITSGTGGVIVPSAAVGRSVVIVNKTGATINIYPASGQLFDSLAANAPITLSNGGFVQIYGVSATSWTSLNTVSSSGSVSSIDNNVAAVGTTQATATPITKNYSIITSITTSGGAGGVILPTGTVGTSMTVTNNTQYGGYIYPPVGGTIDQLATNASLFLGAGYQVTFFAVSATNWVSNTNPLFLKTYNGYSYIDMNGNNGITISTDDGASMKLTDEILFTGSNITLNGNSVPSIFNAQQNGNFYYGTTDPIHNSFRLNFDGQFCVPTPASTDNSTTTATTAFVVTKMGDARKQNSTLILETRTTDPTTPAVGTMWIRTDLVT